MTTVSAISVFNGVIASNGKMPDGDRRTTFRGSLRMSDQNSVPDPLYGSYLRFKEWNDSHDKSAHRVFQKELAPLKLQADARVLELGFGEGRFLDFARDQGYKVTGIEIIPELVAAAEKSGHDVILGGLDVLEKLTDSFDLIVALDVIEHLDRDELNTLFRQCARLLRPGGSVFLRCPNGSSPFSLGHQNSDLTHRSFLTDGSIRQVAEPFGLEVVTARNPLRVLPDGLMAQARRRAVYLLRDLIETAIGYAYFGRRCPLDPNLVIVIKRKADLPLR